MEILPTNFILAQTHTNLRARLVVQTVFGSIFPLMHNLHPIFPVDVECFCFLFCRESGIFAMLMMAMSCESHRSDSMRRDTTLVGSLHLVGHAVRASLGLEARRAEHAAQRVLVGGTERPERGARRAAVQPEPVHRRLQPRYPKPLGHLKSTCNSVLTSSSKSAK